jgi:pectate lyase
MNENHTTTSTMNLMLRNLSFNESNTDKCDGVEKMNENHTTTSTMNLMLRNLSFNESNTDKCDGVEKMNEINLNKNNTCEIIDLFYVDND